MTFGPKVTTALFRASFSKVSLEKEIDFVIDLLPDTQPMSIPAYRMALAKLKE